MQRRVLEKLRSAPLAPGMRCLSQLRMKLLDEQRLAARVGIMSATAIDDIKAVTHHELTVRKCDDGWEATVVFDI